MPPPPKKQKNKFRSAVLVMEKGIIYGEGGVHETNDFF